VFCPRSWKRQLTNGIGLGNALASLALATQDESSSPILRSRSLDKCVDLKIMPLGASITWGTDSSTGDGYRGPLEKLILGGGNNIAFVGTRNNGVIADNAVEAYPGLTISQVQDKSENSGSYDYLPNVILINLGTNDCISHIDTANAPTRMVGLVQNLTTAIPNTAVIVSNLITNLDPAVEQCIEMVNSGFQTEVAKLTSNSAKVVFADMHSAVPASDINTFDKTHPNDDGYQKMANVWYEALGRAANLISTPSSKGKEGFMQPQASVPKCAAVAASSSAATSSTGPSMSTSVIISSSTIPSSTASSLSMTP
jgi:lysophospholipase L1-like esterase